jgi:hypothetical protein
MGFAGVARDGRKLVLALVLALSMVAPAMAGPQQEYERGREMYFSGDVVNAMSVLRPVADQGYAPAQTLLAYILDKSEYNAAALKYYRMAAEQGYAAGEYGLGTMYASGDAGKKDPARALQWIRRAAEKGDQNAIMALAGAYRTGELGLKPDPAQARLWKSRIKKPKETVPPKEKGPQKGK